MGVLQAAFYMLAGIGYLESKKGNGHMLPGLAYTFVTVSVAYLAGWLKYFSGETYTTWSSERIEKS